MEHLGLELVERLLQIENFWEQRSALYLLTKIAKSYKTENLLKVVANIDQHKVDICDKHLLFEIYLELDVQFDWS